MNRIRLLTSLALVLACSLSGTLRRLPKEIAHANNTFGMELFYLLNQPGKNVILAPFSLNSVLYMSYLGARGTTEANMKAVLGLTTSPRTLSRSYAEYLSSLRSAQSLSNGYTYTLNNGMWIQQKSPVLKKYKTLIKDSFNGYIQPVDFAKPEQVVYAVNNEITKATNGRLSEFLESNDVEQGMRMLLTNVSFFRGEWEYPFSTERSRPAAFHPFQKTKPVMTRTMFAELMVPYYEDQFVQAIALPIKARSTQPKMEMMVILPRAKSSTPPFNYLYNGKDIETIAKEMRTERVTISLPRFTFAVRIPLIGSLQSLGMNTAFTPQADFSNITGKRNLMISSFLTQAYFSINEGGVVATAGSSAGFKIKSSFIHKKAKVFEANHPFLYVLRDSYSNVIHFIGEYDAPAPETFKAPRVTLEPQAPVHPDAPKIPDPLDEEDSVSNPSGVEGNPSQGR